MKDAGYFTLMGFKAATSGMLTENDTQIFVKRTVQEIVWGYDDKLTEMGRQFMPDSGLKSDKFGLFAGRNHSVDARFTVFTGEGNLDQLGILKLFNNKSSYEVWPGKDCDRLRGKLRVKPCCNDFTKKKLQKLHNSMNASVLKRQSQSLAATKNTCTEIHAHLFLAEIS